MKSVLIIGHGEVPKGYAHAMTMFFGDDIELFDYLCLYKDTGIDEFSNLLKNKLAKLDMGSGIIILADLFGGSPCNQAILQLKGDYDLLAGFNFPLLVDILSARNSDLMLENSLENARNMVIDVREYLRKLDYNENE